VFLEEELMERGKYFKYIFIAPTLVILAVTAFYPMYFALDTSFHRWKLTRSIEPEKFIGLDNYTRAFEDDNFINSFKVSLEIVAISVPLSVILGLAIALLLQKATYLNIFSRTFLILPFTIAPALKGYLWRFMLNPEFGMFDNLVDKLIPPLADIVWLEKSFWAIFMVSLTEIWGWAPLIALMFLGGLSTIDQEVIDAARTDGANSLQTMLYVTLPMLRPLILLITVLRIIFSLRLFDQVVTMTGGGPGNSTETLNYFVYENAFRFFDMGYASAVGYILMLIMLVMTYIYVRLLLKGSR
jgi:multiple sugar transport system permease protein